ncbi:hypothetical protein E5161_08990 [Cohnella pontilimi]|uniref:General stress protein 17M-like domain-containing protein n=1 Tax=Cohnella pontilimi TaxID=2564100 RepID=A0A4U0FBP6_9BACL|nr:hypothetical protein [Cohnella pontilimi]TJY42137.1 hypothetical protein E5161_08990 [Cohnella pontilimi]
MSVNIGIFKKEADVVEAIRLLREAGVDHDDMRVIVKNAEAAPLIASVTDVPVEELAGLQDRTANHDVPGRAGGWPILVAAPVMNGGDGRPGNATGVAAAAGLWGLERDNDDTGEGRLRDIGIPEHASERCGEEVEAGRILLYTEADEDTNADSILRHAGAAEVLH